MGAFRKLMMKIPAEQFETAVRNWVRNCLGDPDPTGPLYAVSLDGKALRGTLKGHARALHLLSLFDHMTGCTLSQARENEKTNEAKAAMEWLRTVVLRGLRKFQPVAGLALADALANQHGGRTAGDRLLGVGVVDVGPVPVGVNL